MYLLFMKFSMKKIQNVIIIFAGKRNNNTMSVSKKNFILLKYFNDWIYWTKSKYF